MNVVHEVAALRRHSIRELRVRYAALFGEETRTTNNKVWLVKRIAWRLQALAEGDLSERARQRALELANDADVRLSAPRSPKATMAAPWVLAMACVQRRVTIEPRSVSVTHAVRPAMFKAG